jgi:AraC family transcriptional activator of pobA
MEIPDASIPVKKRKLISVRHISFAEIVKRLGKKNELFYVIDSSEVPYSLSLLRPYKTNDFSVLYIDKGELDVQLDVTTHHLKEGSLFIKSANSIFQVHHLSQDCHFRMFGFTTKLINASGIHRKHLEALAFLFSQNQPHLQLSSTEAVVIMQLLNLLQQKSRQDEQLLFYNESVYHAFCLFAFEVAALFGQQKQRPLTAITQKEHLTIQFLSLLPDRIKEKRSVHYYADLLSITPKHLSRCVKEVTGKTCGEIIDERVSLEAKVLLDDPGMSVAQVADLLHFSDPFTFSKFFKKHTGLSPLQYRKAI